MSPERQYADARSFVVQQSEVVRVNTGLKVGHYCGEMGVDFWDHATWVKEFETNEVRQCGLDYIIVAQYSLAASSEPSRDG
jgi:hypothetical protein